MAERIDHIQEALDAIDQADLDVATSAEDDIRAIEGDLLEYFHSWYSEDETDAIMRQWRVTHSIGGTAMGEFS